MKGSTFHNYTGTTGKPEPTVTFTVQHVPDQNHHFLTRIPLLPEINTSFNNTTIFSVTQVQMLELHLIFISLSYSAFQAYGFQMITKQR